MFWVCTIVTDVWSYVAEDDRYSFTDNILPLSLFWPYYDVTFFRGWDNRNYVAFGKSPTRGLFIPYSRLGKSYPIEKGVQPYVDVKIGNHIVEVLADSGSGGGLTVRSDVAKRINMTSYPKLGPPPEKSPHSEKENVKSGQLYTVPVNFGHGLVIPTQTLVYDGYPDNNFGMQKLFKLGVSYKSSGLGFDNFQSW
jgi:hypothetical protein